MYAVDVTAALTVHAVRAELPAGEFEPAGQLVQSVDPITVLYFPAPHCTHGSPLGPEKPALHIQFATDELLKVEVEFPGHNKHAEASVDEYVPVSHSTHSHEGEKSPYKVQFGCILPSARCLLSP